MRLIDAVLASPPSSSFMGRTCAPEEGIMDALDKCVLRYVLDSTVAEECGLMVDQGSADFLLDEQLSVPGESVWLEYRCETGDFADRPCDIGLWLCAEDDLRAGWLWVFFRFRGEQAYRAPGRIWFDLNDSTRSKHEDKYTFRLTHKREFSAATFANHASLRLDRSWADSFGADSSSQLAEATNELAEFMWINLPYAFAFFLLLTSTGTLERKTTDLSRLNAARSKQGRRALKDHVVVRLNLAGPQSSLGAVSGGPDGRAPSRRHLVRGHLVSRQGKIFWRCTHLRGSLAAAILKRTVYVSRSRR